MSSVCVCFLHLFTRAASFVLQSSLLFSSIASPRPSYCYLLLAPYRSLSAFGGLWRPLQSFLIFPVLPCFSLLCFDLSFILILSRLLSFLPSTALSLRGNGMSCASRHFTHSLTSLVSPVTVYVLLCDALHIFLLACRAVVLWVLCSVVSLVLTESILKPVCVLLSLANFCALCLCTCIMHLLPLTPFVPRLPLLCCVISSPYSLLRVQSD